jgi:hypothetical protein
VSFHYRGAVPLGSAAYVTRPFEQSAFDELAAGRWVLLLGPRQHGKSSAIARLRAKLRAAGTACARIDLQKAPPLRSYDELLAWFARAVARELGVDLERQPAKNERGELEAWLRLAVPASAEPVAILVDEASAIRDAQWRTAFYSQLRALANERGLGESVIDVAQRVSLLFAGTFSPDDLMPDQLNSPFNVCTRLETEDLTREDAATLVTGTLGADIPQQWIDEAFDLVGGQPYLLQRLFAPLEEVEDPEAQRALLDEALADMRYGADDHFTALFARVLSDDSLSELTRELVSADDGVADRPSVAHRFLPVLGLARCGGGRLSTRNVLYRELALANPLLFPNAPVTRSSSQLMAPPSKAFDVVVHEQLRDIAIDCCNASVAAHNAGSNRLALAGIGAALEAVLIDHLMRLDPLTLTRALQQSRVRLDGRFEQQPDPTSWRLASLVAVACRTTALEETSLPAADMLREWRSEIHPGAAISRYRADEDLAQEFGVGLGVLGIVLRELAASSVEA